MKYGRLRDGLQLHLLIARAFEKLLSDVVALEHLDNEESAQERVDVEFARLAFLGATNMQEQRRPAQDINFSLRQVAVIPCFNFNGVHSQVSLNSDIPGKFAPKFEIQRPLAAKPGLRLV